MATETLKDSFWPSMGISRMWSQRERRSGGIPWTSSPRRRANLADGEKLGSGVEFGDCSRARI